jgi:hypothetical protein
LLLSFLSFLFFFFFLFIFSPIISPCCETVHFATCQGYEWVKL